MLSLPTVFTLAAIASPIAPALDHCPNAIRAEEIPLVLARVQSGAYLPAAAAGQGQPVLEVPLAVHVVRLSTGSGGLTFGQIDATLADLETAFAPAGITFCLAGDIDFIDSNQAYLFTDTLWEIDELRQTNVVPDAINIYFTGELAAGVPLCGISSFTFSDVQGIVVRNSCTAAGGDASTLAHEVGHYLDLYHTHETALGVECPDGSNCAVSGDLLCDTPADPGLGPSTVNGACQYVGPAQSPCPGSLYDPETTNFMSYSRDECRTSFSPGQIQRMRATLVNLRPGLLGLTCPDLDFEPAGAIELLSVDTAGFIGDDSSSDVGVSGDGRLVVFASKANHLVPGDTGRWDVFLHDRAAQSTTRLSLTPSGDEASGDSRGPSITPDGRFVTFRSEAANLDDPLGMFSIAQQIFVKDLQTGMIRRASRDMSGDLVSGSCDVHATSRNGRYVAYVTSATNVVPDDTNGSLGRDVFLYDSVLDTTERVNVSTDGAQADGVTTWSWDRIDLSDDGRFVVFSSYASNLVPGDTNDQPDIFIRDRRLQTTRRISVGPDGQQANGGSSYPQITAGGRYVFYSSAGSNLVPDDANGSVRDILRYDRVTGETTVVALAHDGSAPDGSAFDIQISPCGRYVAFESFATNYADDDPASLDVFVHDLVTGRTVLGSPRGGTFQPSSAVGPAVAGNGSIVAFASTGADLVPNDRNGFSDVFVTPADTRLVGDIDGDGGVGFPDLGALLGAWGSCTPPPAPCPADLDGDGGVGFLDLTMLLEAWGAAPAT
jgi:Tol biopolymer transport system component